MRSRFLVLFRPRYFSLLRMTEGHPLKIRGVGDESVQNKEATESNKFAYIASV